MEKKIEYVTEEKDWHNRGLALVSGENNCFKDSEGGFWFCDETASGAYGPYQTLAICKAKSAEYSAQL